MTKNTGVKGGAKYPLFCFPLLLGKWKGIKGIGFSKERRKENAKLDETYICNYNTNLTSHLKIFL
jgi:hypothetical protein